MPPADSAPANRLLRAMEAITLVVIALYFGRPVLMPLALALLISFLLTPPVSALERRHVPRVLAVGLVVFLIGCISTLVAWKTVDQLSELVLNLPEYKANLREKIVSVRGSGSRTFKTLENTVSEVARELERTSEVAKEAAGSTEAGTQPTTVKPIAVRVVPEAVNPWTFVQTGVAMLAEPLAQAGIVIVLVIFILMSREDLRNRFVRLAGTGRITLTTRTLDEVESRISRFLLMNALVNGGFGLVVGSGLYLLGVHYAVLWGFLAAVLRFVPYIGPIVASVLPIAMSVIQSPDWGQPLMTVGLFVVVELITNNIVEPLTYGHSSGVSTVALLVAAVFWSWIWGPVGLMLSVPLTVVLVVLGKYVTPLESLWILLGDEPALPPYVQLYQRLLAGDAEEASHVVEDFASSHTRVQIYDELLIPALAMAARDRRRGQLEETDQEFVWSTTQTLLEEYLEPGRDKALSSAEPAHGAPTFRNVQLLGVAATDRSDALALDMLSRSLPNHVDLQTVGVSALASELLELVDEAQPAMVVISALGTGGVGQVRYLCKRLRQRFPDMTIVVGRWGFEGDVQRMSVTLQTRGASQVVTTIGGALEIVHRAPRSQQTVAAPANTGPHAAAPLVGSSPAAASTLPDRPAIANT